MRLVLLIAAGIALPGAAPLRAAAPGDGIEQLGAPDRRTAADQLASPVARDTRPPEPLSRPVDGRPTAMERLAGDDRCDPAAAASTRVPACATVIESRAGDFERPPVALTPEQRLLVKQRIGSPGGTSDQAVASVVLQGAAPPPPREEGRSDPTGAAIDAIVDGATREPPR